MPRLVLLLALALNLIIPAHAGVVDFFNGVTIGAQLPKHDLIFLGAPAATENKLLLIDFWATWCGPCRTSIPRLNALHEKFAERGLTIIGVSQETRDVVEPFLAKIPMQYPSAIEGEAKLHVSLKIKALPYAIFVDRTGKIIWRGQPDAITDKLIEILLADKAG